MDAVSKGERYWLNDEDEAILKETNRDFEQVSPLEQLFHCYFRVTEEEREGEWLTAMEIFNYLAENPPKLSVSKIRAFQTFAEEIRISLARKRIRGKFIFSRTGWAYSARSFQHRILHYLFKERCNWKGE